MVIRLAEKFYTACISKFLEEINQFRPEHKALFKERARHAERNLKLSAGIFVFLDARE
jgi:hypothetical protein